MPKSWLCNIIHNNEPTFVFAIAISYIDYYTDIDRDGHEISRFGGLPRELYFPQGIIFSRSAQHWGKYCPEENITILAPPTRDISSVPVDICYIRWSKLMISSKLYVLYELPRSLVTRLGVCVQNKTEP